MSDLEVYKEIYWEVFDQQNARVIAHFFDSRYSDLFAAVVNAMRDSGRADDE